MKVLVAVKRVIDYNVKIRVKADNSDVDLTNVKMAMNPFCEIAVEEAVRLKEQGVASEIVAVTVGPKAAQEQVFTHFFIHVDESIVSREAFLTAAGRAEYPSAYDVVAAPSISKPEFIRGINRALWGDVDPIE